MERLKQRMLWLGYAAWRRLPRGFRRRAMTRVAAMLARKPDAAPPSSSQGIAVAGDMAFTNGLAESGRIMHEVIADHGLARGFIPLGLPISVPVNTATVPGDAAILAVVNAPIMPLGLLRLPRRFIARRRVIGLWAWELPVLPRSWHDGADFVHEIWAPSAFTAQALSVFAPRKTVRVVPFPLAAARLEAAGSRAAFGLPRHAVVVLTVINLASSMARINPLGAIAAFKSAFGGRRDVLFVLKLSGTEAYPADLALIRAAIGEAGNIRLITETFGEAELRGLIAAADIVLSLHRSEGFGLVLATAMLFGRPVVATGWSGNLTFMTERSAALIACRMVPAEDPRGIYDLPRAVWAEPDQEDAVNRLLHLAEDAAARERLGQAGRAQARLALGAEPMLQALAANGVA